MSLRLPAVLRRSGHPPHPSSHRFQPTGRAATGSASLQPSGPSPSHPSRNCPTRRGRLAACIKWHHLAAATTAPVKHKSGASPYFCAALAATRKAKTAKRKPTHSRACPGLLHFSLPATHNALLMGGSLHMLPRTVAPAARRGRAAGFSPRPEPRHHRRMLQPNIYAHRAGVGHFSFAVLVFHSFFIGLLVVFT